MVASASFPMAEMVRLIVFDIASSSDGIAADKIASFCGGWRYMASPSQNKVPCCSNLEMEINATINRLPTKLESPLFSGDLGNKL